MSSLKLAWWSANNNWGDAINPLICNLISGKKIDHVATKDLDGTLRYYCIGSVLDHPASPNFEVWGSGFMYKTSTLKFKPNKIHAVRGKLTRDLLIKQGLDCPEIYGDPALLYQKFYKPKVKKEYRFGIIPHFIDQNHPWVKKHKDDPEVNIINILDDSINNFVDEINKCEIILSSSLHGVICGDSYGVPSYWIKLSNKVLGGGFKFKDYFSSVGRLETRPIKPRWWNQIKSISNKLEPYNINIDLDLLYQSCPFKK